MAAFGLFVPPPNRVRMELFRDPCALGPWILARTLWSAPELTQPVSAPPSPWFADRRSLPPVPPSEPRLVASAPVVVFITIDAVRADVIADAANDRVFPTIAGLKRSGAYFKSATSPGSQTAVSLTSVFSGRYFSQLFWQHHGEGESRFTYAAADPSPRFPELLTASGVRTVSSLSLNFLASEFGVTRGFAEEIMIAAGRKHALAKLVVDPMLERLGKIKPGEAAFFYAHLTEPHAPYDRGGSKGTEMQRYIAEIGVADAQIARVARLLAQRFPDRGVLILSADHGEAFGEHGTFLHTKTLYDELLRVPLLVGGAGVRGRRIEERVGLIDIGPTILDIFGVPTPPGFMGQSLVPLLRGEGRALDRPILAEGRLRRALYAGSLKVIEDSRRKIVEAYDLSRDPLELNELFSTDRARVEPALAALRAFFEVHAVRAPGYSPPYKP
jgi:arylsulfatase A-like enzyme